MRHYVIIGTFQDATLSRSYTAALIGISPMVDIKLSFYFEVSPLENTQPWEFARGTKEIRYYLQANGCTYLIGGYFATMDSGEPRAISEELFDEIIATFRVTS